MIDWVDSIQTMAYLLHAKEFIAMRLKIEQESTFKCIATNSLLIIGQVFLSVH